MDDNTINLFGERKKLIHKHIRYDVACFLLMFCSIACGLIFSTGLFVIPILIFFAANIVSNAIYDREKEEIDKEIYRKWV